VFLLDTILLAPGKAVLCMFEELAKKAQEEFLDDGAVKQELQDIYGRLEAGTISEQEFEACELRLLQRLEQIARAKFAGSWGTDTMGVERAFLDGETCEETNVELPEPIAHAEVLADPVPGLSPLAPGVDMRAALAPLLGRLAAAAGNEPPRHETAPPPALGMLAAAGGNEPPRHADPPRHEYPPAIAPLPGPAPVAAPLPAPALVAAAAPPLTMTQVIESSLRQLVMLKLKVSALTAVARVESGWRVTAELLERKAVPDTSDLLGVYELHLDDAGNVQRYERTHLRRRCDLGR
jgi:hypothetical protein